MTVSSPPQFPIESTDRQDATVRIYNPVTVRVAHSEEKHVIIAVTVEGTATKQAPDFVGIFCCVHLVRSECGFEDSSEWESDDSAVP